MKIAYLILAHRNPNLIKKVIDFLSCENCGFFIHIDNKSNINDFLLLKGKNVYFVDKRISVYWAEYSMVEAIIMLVRQALDSPYQYEYYILLGGSYYPLRSKEYIHNYLENNRGVEYISLIKIPNEEAGIPLSKINTLRIPSEKPILRFIVRILAKLGLAKRDYRRYLGIIEPYGGSTWWGLTRDACQYVLDFIKNNQAVCKYYKMTLSSDEMLFHTILGNSRFKDRIQRTFMYDDWLSVGPHPAHPAMISERHVKYFEEGDAIIFNDVFGSGEMLFARKFSDDNLDIIRKIDDMIMKKERKK